MSGSSRWSVGYAAMLVATVALYLVIRAFGESLGAPISAPAPEAAGHGEGAAFGPVLLSLAVVRTRIGLIDSPMDIAFTFAVIAVATLGKFGGSYLAARATGMNPRDAGAIGILMNTRGLMELIVLNVGLDLGVISPRLFAMLVVMALVTTFSTTPILDAIVGRRGFGGAPPLPEPAT